MATYDGILHDRIRHILREDEIPFFTDDDVEFYLDENERNADAAIYQMLLVKSEQSSVVLDGLTTPDTSSYFKRLARQYRPWQSGVLGGGS